MENAGLLSVYEDEFSAQKLDAFTSASVGDTDNLESLIIAQTDLNSRNDGGWTPLMYAAYVGHEKASRLLIDNRVSLDTANFTGQTALMLAASCGHENVCTLLLQNGASITASDKQGWNCLVHAANCNHTFLVKSLLKKGANPNQVLDASGNTPFLIACSDGNQLVVQNYLEAGADIDYRNGNGENGIALAARHNHMQIIRLLEKHKTAEVAPKNRHRLLEKTVSNPVQTNCTTNGKDCEIQQQDLPGSQLKSRTYSTKVIKSNQNLDQPNKPKNRFVFTPSRENRPNLPASQVEKVVNGVEHAGSTPSTSSDRKLSSVPSSLAELFDQLQLGKYLPYFEQQEIDLPLFLQMTDTDLKEVGIKLFGPRKKMTNAIARWHRHMPDLEPVERAYANYHRAISEEYNRKNIELNNDLTATQELIEKYKQEVQRIENKMLNACASGRLCNSYVKECKRQAQMIFGDLKKNNFDPKLLEQGLCRICAHCDQILLKLAEGNLI